MIAASLILGGAILIGSGLIVAAILSLRGTMLDQADQATDLPPLMGDFGDHGAHSG